MTEEMRGSWPLTEEAPPAHPFDGMFEPAAQAVAKDHPRIPLSEIAQASSAISLKRIADALTDGAWDLGRAFGHGFGR